MVHDMSMPMITPHPMPGWDQDHGNDAMQCSMSMLWNTSTRGLCVVFASWKITNTQTLLATLLALFLLAILLEYLRLQIRSLDAHLISSHHLTNGILSSLTGTPSHRRKASIQQRRHPSTSNAALLSAGVQSTLGDRRSATDSTTSSWNTSDDDAPLLPGNHQKKRSKRASLLMRIRRALV